MPNILDRLFNRESRASTNPASVVSLEDWRTNSLSAMTHAGVYVTPDTALNMTTVYACVRILAEGVGSLPLHFLQRLTPRGSEKAYDHRLYRILHDQPNDEMTSVDLWEAVTGHLALRGNAYMEKVWGPNGQLRALWPLRPDRMTIKRDADGSLQYLYNLDGSRPEVYPEEKIFHVRGLSSNGIIGFSPVTLARQALGTALAAEEFAGRFYSNGAAVAGVLQHPGKLKDEKVMKRLREQWQDTYGGASNAGKTAILEEGMTYAQVSLSPEDGQLLQTRAFSMAEIGNMFRISLDMLNQHDKAATFASVEQFGIRFVMYTLRPWLVRIEKAIWRSLLLEDEKNEYFAKFNVSGLLRGDFATRMAGYNTGRMGGWLSVNDIRELEDMNPIPDGDIYLQPLNMAPAGNDESLNSDNVRAQPGPIEQRRARPQAESRSARSIRTRRRLRESYESLFNEAATRTVKRESGDIRGALKKHLGKRSLESFQGWLTDFYREHREFYVRQLKPVSQSYAELVARAAADEVEYDEMDLDALERFMSAYVDRLAARHTSRAEKKVLKALDGAMQSDDPLAEMDAFFDEWELTLPARIAGEEVVRQNGAFSKFAYMAAGVLQLTWVNQGSENCPYCTSMDGRTVDIIQSFVESGGALEVDDGDPLAVSSDIGHPPLHDGCDCMIAAA